MARCLARWTGTKGPSAGPLLPRPGRRLSPLKFLAWAAESKSKLTAHKKIVDFLDRRSPLRGLLTFARGLRSWISKIRNCGKDPSAGIREKPPGSANNPMGAGVCLWRKHTGRQDSGASQWRGDRLALRAAAPTQRGLRKPLTLRSYLAEGRSLPFP